jgi:hypothetical protein
MSDHTNKSLLHPPTYMNKHVGGKSEPQNVRKYINDQKKLVKSDNRYYPRTIGEIHERVNYDRSNTKEDLITGIATNTGKNNISNNYYDNIRNNNKSNSNSNNNNNNYSSNNINSPNLDTNNYENDETVDIYLKRHRNRYDPYIGFLEEKGLINDVINNRRFKSTYIDINSAYRQKVPQITTEKDVKLETDPIIFAKNQNNCVTISHRTHNFEVGDLIELTGIFGKKVSVRLIGSQQTYSIEIFRKCNIIKVCVPHGICIPLISGTGIIDSQSCLELQKRITENDLTITITNLQGDKSNLLNGITVAYLQNIPLNIINKTHNFHICINENTITQDCLDAINAINPNWLEPSPKYFFIILDKIYDGDFDIIKNNTENYLININHNFKVEFNFLKGGVPINMLNAEFPIDPQHRQGFHVIKSITENSYQTEITSNILQDYPHLRFSDSSGNPIIGINPSTGAPCNNPNIFDPNCQPVSLWCPIESSEKQIGSDIIGICVDSNFITDATLASRIQAEIDGYDEFIAIIDPFDPDRVIISTAAVGPSTNTSDSTKLTNLLLATTINGVNKSKETYDIDVFGSFGFLSGGEYFNLYAALDKTRY